MDETFYCETCCANVSIEYINSHYKFCEFTEALAAHDIDELLREMGLEGA